MILSKEDITALKEIKLAIEGTADSKLQNLILSVSKKIKDHKFAFSYAGVLAAKHGNIDRALKLLINDDRPFVRVLKQYLEEKRVFAPEAVVFKSTRPFEIWTQTPSYNAYITSAFREMSRFAAKNPPPLGSRSTILDVGTGSGLFIAKLINELAASHGLKEIHLILVDQFDSMLEVAKKNCEKLITIPTKITTIQTKIQDISEAQLAIIKQAGPIWFILAAASIHHMSFEKKLGILKLFKELSSNSIIIDFHGNHDLPEEDSPELIYSVMDFYGYFMADIIKNITSIEDQKLCLYQFELAEALNILKNSRDERGDYHGLIEEWRDLSKQAEFTKIEIVPTVSTPQRQVSFILELAILK